MNREYEKKIQRDLEELLVRGGMCRDIHTYVKQQTADRQDSFISGEEGFHRTEYLREKQLTNVPSLHATKDMIERAFPPEEFTRYELENNNAIY